MKAFILTSTIFLLILSSCRKADDKLPYNPYAEGEIIDLVEVINIEYNDPEPSAKVYYKINLDALTSEQRERVTGLYMRRPPALFHSLSLNEDFFEYTVGSNNCVRFGALVIGEEGIEQESLLGSEICLEL